MVDRAIVQRKLAALSEYRGQLQEYANISVEAYRADWKIQRIVERTLQMMIELCADISGHVISDNGWSTPETYAETFRVLGEHGVLTPEQTVVMVKMAKFRNIVVHQYEALDAEIVMLILRKHLDDFEKFSKAMVVTATASE